MPAITVALAAGACLAGAMVVRAKGLIALGTMMLVGIGFVLLLVRAYGQQLPRADHDRILRWTLAAFAAHLLFGLAVSHSAGSVRFFGGDAVTYHVVAKQIMQHWTAGAVMPHLPGGKEGFYYLLAGLYWVFGPFSTAGLALNAAFAAGLLPVVSDSTRRLFGEAPVRYVAPLVVLVPGLFIWTSQLLKEAPILFFIAVAVNCAVRMTERPTFTGVVTFAGAVALLLSFRGHVGFFIAAGLFAGVIVGRRQLLTGVAAGAVVLAAMTIVVVVVGVGESGFDIVTGADLQQANVTRQGLAYRTGSGFGEDVDISTSRRAVSYLPVGLVNFLLGPFPWQQGGARQLVAIPDVLVWWWLIPSLWAGYRESRRLLGRRSLLLVLPAAFASGVLALVISNYGTVVREREQLVVILVPLIALGLAGRAAARAADDAAPARAAG